MAVSQPWRSQTDWKAKQSSSLQGSVCVCSDHCVGGGLHPRIVNCLKYTFLYSRSICICRLARGVSSKLQNPHSRSCYGFAHNVSTLPPRRRRSLIELYRFLCMAAFWLLRVIPQPLAASMAGVRPHGEEEETLRLSKNERRKGSQFTMSFSRKGSYDSSFFSPSPKASVSGPSPWLPQRGLENSNRSRTMLSRSATERGSLNRARSERSALLPSPNLALTRTPTSSTRAWGTPSHLRCQIFDSPPQCQLTALACPHGVGSSRNDIFYNAPRAQAPMKLDQDEPPVSQTLEKAREPSKNSLRNGGIPMRPRSRPPMPPAEFWDYAREEQKKRNQPMLEARRSLGPNVRQRRHTEGVINRNTVECRQSILSDLQTPLHENTKSARPGRSNSVCEITSEENRMPAILHPWAMRPDLSDIFDENLINTNNRQEGRGRTLERTGSRPSIRSPQL